MKFIATVEDNQKSRIGAIATTLKGMGVDIDRVLKITGVITGTVKNNNLASIKIKGIKSVEEERKVYKSKAIK